MRSSSVPFFYIFRSKGKEKQRKTAISLTFNNFEYFQFKGKQKFSVIMKNNNVVRLLRNRKILPKSILVHQKSEKERKRNAKRNARSCSEKGTEQERGPDLLKRNVEGTRS